MIYIERVIHVIDFSNYRKRKRKIAKYVEGRWRVVQLVLAKMSR